MWLEVVELDLTRPLDHRDSILQCYVYTLYNIYLLLEALTEEHILKNKIIYLEGHLSIMSHSMQR